MTEDPDDEDEVPGRSWFRLAALIGASLLLLIAVVVAFNLGRGKSPLGTDPDPSRTPSDSATTEETEPLEELPITGARDLDPQGDPPEENSDLAPLAVDGDPGTAWQTVEYNDQLGPPPGLKTGVGLVVDLGESAEVAQIELTTVGTPTDVTYYLTDQDPTGVADLEPLTRVTLDRERVRTSLDEPASGRYLVVWLTELPAVPAGFQGVVAEVVVRG